MRTFSISNHCIAAKLALWAMLLSEAKAGKDGGNLVLRP